MDRRVFALSIFIFLVCAVPVRGQANLLRNPNADGGAEYWRASANSTVEELNGDNVFVIRSDGSRIENFQQDVDLTASDVGKYALLIGKGSSERINADAAITGLPYLYGYMMESNSPLGGTINTYLQGQQMLGRSSTPNLRVKMFGIFRVPEGTVAIRFFMMQAERRGVPPNGSAARFDNVGLYLFESKQDAVNFASAYR